VTGSRPNSSCLECHEILFRVGALPKLHVAEESAGLWLEIAGRFCQVRLPGWDCTSHAFAISHFKE